MQMPARAYCGQKSLQTTLRANSIQTPGIWSLEMAQRPVWLAGETMKESSKLTILLLLKTRSLFMQFIKAQIVLSRLITAQLNGRVGKSIRQKKSVLNMGDLKFGRRLQLAKGLGRQSGYWVLRSMMVSPGPNAGK